MSAIRYCAEVAKLELAGLPEDSAEKQKLRQQIADYNNYLHSLEEIDGFTEYFKKKRCCTTRSEIATEFSDEVDCFEKDASDGYFGESWDNLSYQMLAEWIDRLFNNSPDYVLPIDSCANKKLSM